MSRAKISYSEIGMALTAKTAKGSSRYCVECQLQCEVVMKAEAEYRGTLSIPLSSTAIETLDLALAHINKLLDRAILHDDDGDDIYAALADATLEKKIEGFYPDGFGADEVDRSLWESVIELEQIRKRATPDTAYGLVEEWLRKEGCLKDEVLNEMPDLRGAPVPLRTEMIFARIAGSMCEYVEGWSDALTSD